MEPAVESGSVGTRASKQAKEGSKNRSRRRWRKGKIKGEPVAARKKVRRSCGGRGGRGDWGRDWGGLTHFHNGRGRAARGLTHCSPARGTETIHYSNG